MERSGYHHILILSVIALVGLLCYSNTFQAPFQFDDLNNITSNRSIYLKELSWQGLVNAAFGEFGNRPVSNVTFAVNYYLGGLDVWGYHVFNWAVHVASAMILYGWIYQTLGLPFFRSSWSQPSAYRVAVFSSLLWVAHPVQTQAVTYIVQRATSMATLFYLACLFAYVMGRIGSGVYQRLWFAISVISAFLALGSKEISITLPIVIILYDAFFICGLERDKIHNKLLLYSLLMAIPLLLGGIKFYHSGFEVFTGYYHPQEFTMGERLLTEGRVVIHYLSLLVFPNPSHLTVDYYFPVSHSLIDPISTFFSWVLVLGLIGTAFFLVKRTALVSFCIMWFFVNLALESTVIMLDLVLEHRLYLPSIGIMILAAVAMEYFMSRGNIGSAINRKYVVIGVVILMLSLLIVWTRERNWVWNDRVALWSDAAGKYPENPRSHYNLATEFLNSDQIEQAIKEYKKAVWLRPAYRDNMIANLNKRGRFYAKKGRLDEALRLFNLAIQAAPDQGLSHYNLGTTLFKKGEFQSAVEHLERSIQLDPTSTDAHNNLGMAYLNLQNFSKAIESFREASLREAKFLDYYQRLGDDYRHQSLFQEAAQIYRMILRIDPTKVKVLISLGHIYNAQGEIDLAVQVLKEAIRLNPKLPEAYNNLGIAYAKAGLLEKAVDAFKEAVRLNPRYAEAQYNLGKAYDLMGSKTLANQYYQQARNLGYMPVAPRSQSQN